MVRVKRSGTVGLCLLILILLVTTAILFTRGGVSDGFPQAVSVWVIGTGSALILIGFKSSVKDDAQCAVLYLAYLARVVCMLVDICGREYVTLLHSGGDTEGFYQGAVELYHGNADAWYLTKYPPIISGIFRITGDNRVCAQYVNILFWVLSCLVLIRLCEHFAVKEKARLWIWILWGFLPTGIFLTSILVRESMEMFFGLWSFERFIYWMEYGKRRHLIEAFVYVLPAIILHSASVALWAAYAVVIMFWNTKRQRYRWQMKSMAVLVCVVVGILLIFYTPLSFWLFTYFGNDFSIYAITHRPYVPGGSDYLAGMDCGSWIQFIPYTLIRMFYFLFSPLPMDARGIKDIAMFLADGFPLVVIICFALVNAYRNKALQGYMYAALLGGFSFAGIFAWGVRNAGTALRHRYLAWSIFMIALCICCGCGEQEEMKTECHIKS